MLVCVAADDRRTASPQESSHRRELTIALNVPAIACRTCGRANLKGPPFCAWCKEPRVAACVFPGDAVAYPPGLVDELDSRIRELRESSLEPSYLASRTQRFVRFCAFLEGALKKPWERATDVDACRYLVHLDGNAQKILHTRECQLSRRPGEICTMGCPQRAAAKSVDSAAGQLRGHLRDLGLVMPWDEHFGTGNPFNSRRVTALVAAVAREQRKARMTADQATPFLLDSVQRLARYAWRVAHDVSLGKWYRYQLANLACVVVIGEFSMKRPGEIGDLAAAETLFVPASDTTPALILFRCMWGKTLRQCGDQIFAVQPCRWDPMVCPHNWLRVLRERAAACEVDLGVGLLFRDVDVRNERTLIFDQEKLNGVLAAHLPHAGVAQKLRLRGLRSGGSIEARLMGASLPNVMQQAVWSNPRMADWYMHIRTVLFPSSVSSSLAEGSYTGPSGQRYRDANELRAALRLFPSRPSPPAEGGAAAAAPAAAAGEAAHI